MKAELVQMDGTISKDKYWAIKLITETGRKRETLILQCPEHQYTSDEYIRDQYFKIIDAINSCQLYRDHSAPKHGW